MALNQYAQYTYKRLQDKYRLTPYQAAGVVGNLQQESSFILNARNKGDGRDGTDSIGIGQWNGARARGLHDYAQSTGSTVDNLDTQIDYMMHEMQNGPERKSYDRLMASKNVDQATEAMIGYERPKGYSVNNPRAGHGWDNRIANANEALGFDQNSIRAETSPQQIIAAPQDQSQQQVQPVQIAQADEAYKRRPGLLDSQVQGADATSQINPTDAEKTAGKGIGSLLSSDAKGDIGTLLKGFMEINKATEGEAPAAPQGAVAASQPVQIQGQLLSGAPAGQAMQGQEQQKLKPWEMLMMRLGGGLGGLGGMRV